MIESMREQNTRRIHPRLFGFWIERVRRLFHQVGVRQLSHSLVGISGLILHVPKYVVFAGEFFRSVFVIAGRRRILLAKQRGRDFVEDVAYVFCLLAESSRKQY